MTERACPSCGSDDLRTGWIGDGAQMVALWNDGPLERHLLGAPKLGSEQLVVSAWRCTACGHVSLFAPAGGAPAGG